MAKKTTLAGRYDREGSRLRNEDFEFIIVRRPETERTRAKTAEYILKVNEDNRRSYVSSLWPTNEDGVFTIEYNRTRYRVNIAASEAYFDEVTFDRS